MTPMSAVPNIPVGNAVEDGIDWITDNFGGVLDGISTFLFTFVDTITELLLSWPPLVGVAIFTVLALLVRSWGLALFTLLGTLLIVSMDMWEPAMETLALVLVATTIAVVIAVPVGILAARSDSVSTVVKPILDFMQTMPAFVYLVPVVIFFGIGVAAGVFATIVFALPPGVRLTELGIRGVDSETVEAGEAFGGTPWQILRGIQLPLGLPTIMAGVNQVIMLALSMAVVAGLVGAGGLGQQVVSSISRIDVALGFEAGLSVVILAIFLDRVTGAIGQPTGRSLVSMVRNRRAAPATV
ncbi:MULTISPECIES: proline/glycine betaine ABC transporter permease [unclassified Isoptericola]|uniref:ABC transporter permease n=1 Tax=unclassified Isoptericola TaxID=2623355 RepID=UPI002712FF21|nr:MULTISPECIES: ABC transporter permease subunit [unclassified Isoptericola]MDO8144152.1 ABC transporter permease subunit [Isoptericola sp. 178]MDO8148005.1 ABC transporter permease subunit [Isoptericola sp. b515]MDO8151481.1 ABC transporter permease subunit [Isoptericola sp. b408]